MNNQSKVLAVVGGKELNFGNAKIVTTPTLKAGLKVSDFNILF